MIGLTFCSTSFWLISAEKSYLLIEKVFAPIEAKFPNRLFSKALVSVKIPTRKVIPNTIIKTVNDVRNA